MATLSFREADVLSALRSFLIGVLPPNTEVVKGQGNRVPEPSGANGTLTGDFVVMTPIARDRIETNVDAYLDCAFTASIAGTLMTVSAVQLGTIGVGNQVFGTGVVLGTVITSLASGTGGVGTYGVSPSQSAPSQQLAAGVMTALQPVDVTVQLDVHGPASADNAHIITTLLRDDFAVQAFLVDSTFDISPLYAEEPRQMPFMNAEQQWEYRWVVDAHMQANQLVIVPQDFFVAVKVLLISVDASYPG